MLEPQSLAREVGAESLKLRDSRSGDGEVHVDEVFGTCDCPRRGIGTVLPSEESLERSINDSGLDCESFTFSIPGSNFTVTKVGVSTVHVED
jgi:hypothetical protein